MPVPVTVTRPRRPRLRAALALGLAACGQKEDPSAKAMAAAKEAAQKAEEAAKKAAEAAKAAATDAAKGFLQPRLQVLSDGGRVLHQFVLVDDLEVFLGSYHVHQAPAPGRIDPARDGEDVVRHLLDPFSRHEPADLGAGRA